MVLFQCMYERVCLNHDPNLFIPKPRRIRRQAAPRSAYGGSSEWAHSVRWSIPDQLIFLISKCEKCSETPFRLGGPKAGYHHIHILSIVAILNLRSLRTLSERDYRKRSRQGFRRETKSSSVLDLVFSSFFGIASPTPGAGRRPKEDDANVILVIVSMRSRTRPWKSRVTVGSIKFRRRMLMTKNASQGDPKHHPRRSPMTVPGNNVCAPQLKNQLWWWGISD